MFLEKHLEWVRLRTPSVHCITNYVSANDVANMILACGGRPVMADEPLEVAEMTALCDALNINLGTLSVSKVASMSLASNVAMQLGHARVLDLVGVGASSLRTDTALNLMASQPFDVIKGNVSEMKAIDGGVGTTRGVDANPDELVTEVSLEEAVKWAKGLSQKVKSIVVITGQMDLVSDGEVCYVVRNGHPYMQKITGAGCQLSGLIATFLGAKPDSKREAVLAAVCLMGVAGEIGYSRMEKGEGNATYRNRIIDAVAQISSDTLERMATYEIW